jgi:hypothetical protein
MCFTLWRRSLNLINWRAVISSIRYRDYVRAGRLKNRRLIPRRDKIFFASLQCPNWLSNEDTFFSVGVAGTWNYPLASTSAEVKYEWNFPSNLPNVFFFWFLIKSRDNFILAWKHVCLYLVTQYLAPEYADGFLLFQNKRRLLPDVRTRSIIRPTLCFVADK